MVEAVGNDATADNSAAMMGNLDEDIRPFSDIKAKVEEVVDAVVNRTFVNKMYEARQMQTLVNTGSEEIIKEC